MGMRLAMAGLGLYVVAIWSAVGAVAFDWFHQPAAIERKESRSFRVTPNTAVLASQQPGG